MSRPRVLVLCCGVGGSAMGWHRAGYDVVGVDVVPQPDFPFTFRRMDALEADPRAFDVVDASPPYQADCMLTAGTNAGREYPNITVALREHLRDSGVPYVMENPPGRTALRRDLVLCGEMFGLRVIRHRVFEFGNGAVAPRIAHVRHRGRVAGWRHGEWFDGPYVAVYGDGGGKGSVEQWRTAMGIDWTSDRKSIAEAIPPAYTEFIGRSML